jgi:hypothetical protein
MALPRAARAINHGETQISRIFIPQDLGAFYITLLLPLVTYRYRERKVQIKYSVYHLKRDSTQLVCRLCEATILAESIGHDAASIAGCHKTHTAREPRTLSVVEQQRIAESCVSTALFRQSASFTGLAIISRTMTIDLSRLA